MEPEKLFHEVDNIIRRISIILKDQSSELHKRGLPPQRVSDLKQGVVIKGGVYVPLSSIEHRILLDGYEAIFIDIYISLFKLVYKRRNQPITQFSLRTLAEMGFHRCQILFSKQLTKEEKDKYKLLLMLADYGSMALNHNSYLKTFDKLLKEHENLLTEKQKFIFMELSNSVKAGNVQLHSRLTKRARKLVDSSQDDYFKRTAILPFFNPINVDALFSGFSHILHGNVFLLLDILSTKRPKQHKLRVYWFLLLTGINMINHTSYYLEDSQLGNKIEKLNKDFEKVAQRVKTFWATL